MAKASEMLQLRGKTNGIIFYKRPSGGFSARSYSEGNYRAGAESERSRENQAEFAGMASAMKSLTTFTNVMAIKPYARQLFRNKMWQRYNKPLLNNEQNAGTARGERGARFNEVNLAGEYVTSPISRWIVPQLTHSLTEEGTFSVTVPALGVDDVKAPEGATHYRLVFIAGLISNYAYDEDAGVIAPLNPDDGSLAVSLGTVTELGVATQAGSPVTVSLSGVGLFDCVVFGAVGMAFFQRVGGQDYLLQQEMPLQILDWKEGNSM